MMQDPLVGEQFWPHTMNLLSQMFQNLEVKLLVDSVTRWDKLSVHLQSKKQMNIVLTFDFDTGSFLGWSEPVDFQFMLCHFVSGSY
jgi:hypothetical protein